jgi:hypothetical protein
VTASFFHTFRWITLAVFALAVGALAAMPMRLPKLTAREIRQQLLRELQPIALRNCTLERIGSPHDGGYLMCGNLLDGIQSAYSYGIGPADDWGCDVSRRREVAVHQYDCFDPRQPECPGGRALFHNECLAPVTTAVESRAFDTFTRQISKNGDMGKTLVVKMDVEGAELDALLATEDRVLSRIDQLAVEFHGANERYLELTRKLKRTFRVGHLHFNNQSCAFRYSPFPSWAYQVLFVNKRIAVPDPSAPPPTLPHPLDAPDFAIGRDCQKVLE